MNRTLAIVAALLVLAAGTGAAEPGDPTDLIGMNPALAYAVLGAPAKIFTQRGAAPGEDNVVFFYPDYRYVFWFGSRIWQVGYDRRYVGTVLGFAIGMGRAEAEAAAPGRLRESGGSLYLAIDSGPYPVRVRLAIIEGRVADIYVTRSDW